MKQLILALVLGVLTFVPVTDASAGSENDTTTTTTDETEVTTYYVADPGSGGRP